MKSIRIADRLIVADQNVSVRLVKPAVQVEDPIHADWRALIT